MTPQVNYPPPSPPFPPTKRRKVEKEEVPSSPPVRRRLFKAAPLAPLMVAATPFGEEDPFIVPPGWNCDPPSPVSPLPAYGSNIN